MWNKYEHALCELLDMNVLVLLCELFDIVQSFDENQAIIGKTKW